MDLGNNVFIFPKSFIDVMLIIQVCQSIKIVSMIIYKKICIILNDIIEAPWATNAISLPRKRSLNTRRNK